MRVVGYQLSYVFPNGPGGFLIFFEGGGQPLPINGLNPTQFAALAAVLTQSDVLLDGNRFEARDGVQTIQQNT